MKFNRIPSCNLVSTEKTEEQQHRCRGVVTAGFPEQGTPKSLGGIEAVLTTKPFREGS